MKTAIIISGHMRTFDRCIANQAWMVYRHFPGADFFVSTEPDEDGNKAELLDLRYHGRVHIDYTPQPDMEPMHTALNLPESWEPGKPYMHEPYAISVSPLAVLGQLWRLSRAYAFCESERKCDYERIVRLRPDLWFHSFAPPTGGFYFGHVIAPWWGRFGGMNDRVAVMSWAAASHYFGTFDALPKLLNAEGCPFHPESLVRASLENGGLEIIDDLDAEFSTIRKDGTARGPEILPSDLVRR